MIGVWVYMAYAIFDVARVEGRPRSRRYEELAGQRQDRATWIVLTTVLVLFLAGFGTYELIQPEGAGGGQGPTPLWTPASKDVLPGPGHRPAVEVDLPLPELRRLRDQPSSSCRSNTTIAFHVTSLDVIHDFWAYQLGVKADANPEHGQRRVHHAGPDRASSPCAATSCAGSGTARCTTTGKVVSQDRLRVLGDRDRDSCSPRTPSYLPPFAWSYSPDANGADGGYYPDTVDPLQPCRDLRGADAGGRADDDGAAGHHDGGHGLMALDTSGESRTSESGCYPGEIPLHQAKRVTLSGVAPPAHPLGRARRGRRLRRSATGSATSSPAATRSRRTPGRTTSPSSSRSCFGVVGWLAGIGAFNYPLLKIDRARAARRRVPDTSWTRYFRMTARPQGRRACSTSSAS